MKSRRVLRCMLQSSAFFWVCVIVLFAQHCTSLEDWPTVSPDLHGSSLHASGQSGPPRSTQLYNEAQHRFSSRSFRFSLCNGFANQRIGLASGIIFAHLLGRSAVLPNAVANGTQATDDWNLGQLEDLLPLSAMYDTEYLLGSLQQSGILAIGSEAAPPPANYHSIRLLEAPSSNILEWLATFSEHAHLMIDCPFFRLPPTDIKAHAPQFWAVLDALRPSQPLNALVQKGVSKLRAHNRRKSFTFLHLRIENDWLAHCTRWSHIPDGIVRNNCFNNTFSLSEHLKSKGIVTAHPLYIASSWKEASSTVVKQVMANLISGGYHVVTRSYLFPDHDRLLMEGEFSREQLACVDYYLALESSFFIGNSVSSFSAMLLLERQRQGTWASYYNGGNVPMSVALPLFHLPWVFTYNSWSAKYDYMLKAAVRSGLDQGMLKPYCLFAGDATAPIVAWLEGHGVTMIHATPTWVDRLVAVLKASNDSNIAHSHLYANANMQVGTWQRIDIPILPVLSQYEYVLFTDADVYFRRPLTLDAFKLPLPETIGMASEAEDIFPYNAGIMLMHLPAMRTTYDDFLDFIFSNKHGLYFPAYGPGDQGAINQFYESSVRDARLTQDFNAKPYHHRLDTAYIVHFHGPKPGDYLPYFDSGTCAFGNLCKDGVDNAFCFYALEWAKYVQDEEIGQVLQVKCSAILHGLNQTNSPPSEFTGIASE